jgi:2-keto-4-pentenoate hydratase|tara:strand:- start:3706 stop:4683 length:978 start_codon:yes stop_codon:yes gene_type:complete
MNNRIISLTLILAVAVSCVTTKKSIEINDAYFDNEIYSYDLTNPDDQRRLGISFMGNFNEATPIDAIPFGQLSESDAYEIADYYVEEQLKTRGTIAGYKIGTFAKGKYDNGPVDGLSGPITAVMFSNGIHQSNAHISVDCCNMSFVEADFGAVVANSSINNAKSELEILAALSGFIPFIEMPDIIQPIKGGSSVSSIATNYDFKNAIVGNLIKTEATTDWINRLNNFTFTMTNETGELLAEGKIKNAYEPLYRVRYLRDRLLLRGRKLKAGDLLSLGNMGAIRPLKENLYFDAITRPVFKGNVATVTYIGLDPRGPATVSVSIDR